MPCIIALDGDQPEGLTIEDDETQTYNLTTDDDDAKEGDDPITVTVTANPAHDSTVPLMLTAQLDSSADYCQHRPDPSPSDLEVIGRGRACSQEDHHHPGKGTTRTVSKTRSRSPCIRARRGIPSWLTHCPSISKTSTRCLRSR